MPTNSSAIGTNSRRPTNPRTPYPPPSDGGPEEQTAMEVAARHWPQAAMEDGRRSMAVTRSGAGTQRGFG